MINQKQTNIQAQQQKQSMQQRLSPLQVKVMRMLEMPLAQLEDNVIQELDANPSLERDYSVSDNAAGNASDNANDNATNDTDNATNDTEESRDEAERRGDAINDALEQIGQDDRMEGDDGMTLSDYYATPRGDSAATDTETRQFEAGDNVTFIDTLTDQMLVEELTDDEKRIMQYLIFSLDDDGLLRTDIPTIADELAIYENIYATNDEIENVLHRLQEFNPPGIASQSLKECLTIQVERMKATPLTMMMYDVINNCYDDFINNRWEKIQRTLNISEQQAEDIRKEIKHRLNPKPGATLNEAQGRSLQQITPDIIIDTDEEGHVTFELNNGRIPALKVSETDAELLAEMQHATTKAEKEALAFTQRYVDKARLYIEAIRQRNETLLRTVAAIISLQKKFFITGDDNDLRPMVLKDISEKTGFDISTISRATRSKYAQMPWGTVSLRHFFSEGYNVGDDNIVSTKAIKSTLRQIIAAEDPKNPFSDDKLVAEIKRKGYPIARRTIAKYREQMGIPVARLRKR